MGDDRAGFAAFVRDGTRSLYGTALVLTVDPHTAEELLQDPLVRLYPKWAKVAAADSPIAYVRRALINGFVSARRSPRARELTVAEPRERSGGGDFADTVANHATLVQLLRALPPRPRAALV